MVVSEQSALKVGETSNPINSTLKVQKFTPFPPTQNKRKLQILARSGQKRKIVQELVVAQPTTTAVVAEERQTKTTAKITRDSALQTRVQILSLLLDKDNLDKKTAFL